MQNNHKLLTLTNIIILINLIMFGVQNTIEHGDILLGLNIYFYKAELYYQPLSSMFAHGGWGHILMNMFVLYQFGNMIENVIGKFRYILLYFIGGLVTSFLSLYYMELTEDWVNLVGASGAICVLLGWFALKDKFQRSGIIVWILLISFAPLLLGVPVAWYAHLIGFALGWIMGYIL